MPPQWEVKVQQGPKDAHLTRPLVGVEGAANRVAPPLLQLVAVLGVYRDGQQDTREVTPTDPGGWLHRAWRRWGHVRV